MSSQNVRLISGAGATLALSAARMFIDRIPGYSVWCLAGGAAVAYAEDIASYVPVDLRKKLDDMVAGGSTMIVVGVIGALAHEMAFDGALSMTDLNLNGAMRAAVGAGAALLGSMGALMAAMTFSGMGK